MISVEEALERILNMIPGPLPVETISLADADRRVLAEHITARRTQPPRAASAMDGYAVRAEDVSTIPANLKCVGESRAGAPFAGSVGKGETVRIFTGAGMPDGADSVVIQEDVTAKDNRITANETAVLGHHVREAGIDFREGRPLLHGGRELTAYDVALLAAMDVPWVPVRRKPRIAILSTGDELVWPGERRVGDQIVTSNNFGIAALVRQWGGDPIDLGIARDTEESLQAAAAGARGADIFVTIGGVSVGDYDLVKSVLGEEGLETDFSRVAMRPGRPLMSGRMNDTLVMGLPGNPASSLVCALVFLKPAIDALLGRQTIDLTPRQAELGVHLPANGPRQDYMRASLTIAQGVRVATPFHVQDSSLLTTFSLAECLVVRAPHAVAAPAGATVEVIPLTF